jgi:polyisoprenoid-binding protein YceI
MESGSSAMPQGLSTIDSGYSSVEFSVTAFGFVTVRGSFAGVSGTIERDVADVTRSSVEATINAASLTTGKAHRDARLRSPTFLDADGHPEIHFESTRVERRDRDSLRVTGVLTVRGRSKEIVLDVAEVDRSISPRGEELLYYSAKTEIDRFEFGMTTRRWLIGRKLKVSTHVQAIR